MAHNDIADYIEQDDGFEGQWHFKETLDHKGPLYSHNKEYDGSKCNVQIAWENGEISWVPLHVAHEDSPIEVAIHAAKNKLLDTPGWRLPGLKKMAKTQKRLI